MNSPHLGWNATALWRFLPPGETIETMVAHGAANGVTNITVRLGEGDHVSYIPHFEARPGEFYVGGPVERNANGDITSTLYQAGETIPTDCPLMRVFDACAANGVGVTLQLGDYGNLKGDFVRHPYTSNRLNAKGNVSGAGLSGWLKDFEEYWTDARAIAAYKNRIDAAIGWFGNHPALDAVDLGNEYLLYYWTYRQRGGAVDYQTMLFQWVRQMATYLWGALPGLDADKPMVTISTAILPVSGNIAAAPVNAAYNQIAAVIPAGKTYITWHDYANAHTLSRIRSALAQFTKHYPVKIGENWPYPAGPKVTPPGYQDVNLDACSYDATPELDPYTHTRMEAYLLATIPGAIGYSRWWSFVDGFGKATYYDTIKRVPELTAHAAPFFAACDSLERDVTAHVGVTGPGVLRMASIGAGRGVIACFLSGSGRVTLSAPLSGRWRFRLADWRDGRVVVDTIKTWPVTVNFDKFPRGVVVGLAERAKRGKVRGIHARKGRGLGLLLDDGTQLTIGAADSITLVDERIAAFVADAEPPITVHRNRDGNYAVATGIEPAVWPEDEVI